MSNKIIEKLKNHLIEIKEIFKLKVRSIRYMIKRLDALDEAKEDFDLFHKRYSKYKEKVDSLSALFKLTNKAKLRSDYLPTYFVGNYKSNDYKYVLFSLNPGFSEKRNEKEEAWKKPSWDAYLNFIKNFFLLFKSLFKEHNMKSRYYERLSNLFSGLANDNIELKNYPEIYDYYQKHLINIDLLPYHSTCFGISKC